MDPSRLARPALALGFAAAAFAAVLWVTRAPGPGIDPDAMSYLGAAQSFASDGTLVIPAGDWRDSSGTSALSHFPPGFSIVLAGPIALGVEPVQAARGVEALAAATTAGLAVWLASGAGGMLAGALAGVLLFLTPGLALDHLRVLSEPLFLALAALVLLLMVRAPDRPLAHGLAAALATAVRFAGLAFGGAAALWALSRPGPVRHRLVAAILAGAPALLVQVAWTLRARLEGATVRSFGLKSGLGATLHEGWATLATWLAPGAASPTVRAVVALLALGLVAAVIAFAALRERTFLGATGLLAACYAALVLVSRLFADEWIPLDERLLSPLMLFVSLAVAVAVGALWREARPPARSVGGFLLAAWIGASAWRTVVTVRDARDGGWGYSQEDWRTSEEVRWLRAESAHHPIFSDNPADVWFATGRRSWMLPLAADPESAAAFGAVLRRRDGVLVGFPNPLEPMASPRALAARLGLPVVARFEGAVAWGPPSTAAAGDEKAPQRGAGRR